MPDLMREDRLSSVDEEEWGLARQLGGSGADGPHHRREFIVLSSSAGFELLLKGPGLEAPQDLRVGALGLAIAPGVRYRGVANLRSKVSTVCLEKVTGEL